MNLPEKLFGRVWQPPIKPNHAKLKAMWHAGLPLPPPTFDVDASIGLTFPARMYLNDSEGDCVLVTRANHQTRIIAWQTGIVPNILDSEVNAEYFKETGGPDTGLVPEDSIALWKDPGWTAAGGHHAIQAFGRVDATDQIDVQRCISLLLGMELGVALPLAWRDALDAGNAWDSPSDPNDPRWQPGSWGAHEIYVEKYDSSGVYVYTWSALQLITWSGLKWAGATANQGEAMGIVPCPDVDGVDPARHVDIVALLADLQVIEAAS